MKAFNISEWAINHRPFVWYLMIVFVLAGILSYIELGREEDPAFTIKLVATLLTLLFLPALYVAWFRIHEPGAVPAPQRPGAATTGLFTRWFARSS
jgi:multidrug efflux pump subunit AcrB